MKNKILFSLVLTLTGMCVKGDDLTASVTNTSSSTSSTGAIDLAVTGGVAPYTFNWNGPSGFSASTEDISSLAYGTYTVTVTDAYCGTATLTLLVDSASAVGINTVENNAFDFNIYPNPAETFIQVVGNKSFNQGTIRLMDLNGKLIETKITNNGNMVQFDVAYLTKGVYILELREKQQVVRKKFIRN